MPCTLSSLRAQKVSSKQPKPCIQLAQGLLRLVVRATSWPKSLPYQINHSQASYRCLATQLSGVLDQTEPSRSLNLL